MHPVIKALTEYGPLAVFFIANAKFGIFPATAAFMAASALALILSFALTRKIAKMPLITAGFVFVFGGLTLWLNDATFIKVKPTLVYLLFAGILLGGYAMKRYFLSDLFGAALELDREGWRRMTLRWAMFFVALAVLNEYVWRHFSTDMWVNLKVFGFAPLTVIFALLQSGLIRKHMIERDDTT
ncbi:MAG TPA: septation protein A [Rhizobiales bacterium]|nr:septation protein A [Hyphomicrobiales bacterium]